jgi:hypothetical protein
MLPDTTLHTLVSNIRLCEMLEIFLEQTTTDKLAGSSTCGKRIKNRMFLLNNFTLGETRTV